MLGVCAVMVGGRGSRMGGVVKPLVRVCGVRLIEHVLSVLRSICSRIVLVVSPYTLKALREYCRDPLLECLYTPGAGYVYDLSLLLRVVHPRPLLVAPGDAVTSIECLRGSLHKALSLHAPVATFTHRGVPTGFTLFRGDRGSWVNVELECYQDVDTPSDLAKVEELCASMGVARR